jgi:hypothetical protein
MYPLIRLNKSELKKIYISDVKNNLLSTCQNTLMIKTNYLEQVSVWDIHTSCN